MNDLDQQVSEQVMGIELCKCHLIPNDYMPSGEGSFATVKDNMHKGCGKYIQPKPYSTEISDAFSVLDEMINKHNLKTFSIDSVIPNSDPVQFWVEMNGMTATSLNLCRAICKAALLAKEE